MNLLKNESYMHVVIIGAGISGLTLAWKIKQQSPHIKLTVLEKDSRAGGWIHSTVRDDFLFETGPHSCRSRQTGMATLQLIERLGLQDEWIGASPASKKRFLYQDNALLQIPILRESIRCFFKEWKTPPTDTEDESIFNFFSRRFGFRIANEFIDPLVSGIYAGDIHNLSIKSCFPEMYRDEQEYGSLFKAALSKSFKNYHFFKKDPQHSPFIEKAKKFPIFTLRNGMETLTHALAGQIKDHLFLNCEVTSIDSTDKSIGITTNSLGKLFADFVFIALPANATNALVSKLITPFQVPPSSSVAVVNMGWKQDVLKRSGFGYLVPSHSKEDILGVIWDSSVFPEQNRSQNETRLTVMLGGSHRPDIPLLNERKISEMAQLALRKHLKINIAPQTVNVKIAHQAIPQYTIGHTMRVLDLERQLDAVSKGRVKTIGSAWYGVSVNDCIAGAEKAYHLFLG